VLSINHKWGTKTGLQMGTVKKEHSSLEVVQRARTASPHIYWRGSRDSPSFWLALTLPRSLGQRRWPFSDSALSRGFDFKSLQNALADQQVRVSRHEAVTIIWIVSADSGWFVAIRRHPSPIQSPNRRQTVSVKPSVTLELTAIKVQEHGLAGGRVGRGRRRSAGCGADGWRRVNATVPTLPGDWDGPGA